MNTEKSLECLYERNMLNEKGLKQYIKYLKRDVQDHSDRIKEVTKEKGLHNKKRIVSKSTIKKLFT